MPVLSAVENGCKGGAGGADQGRYIDIIELYSHICVDNHINLGLVHNMCRILYIYEYIYECFVEDIHTSAFSGFYSRGNGRMS